MQAPGAQSSATYWSPSGTAVGWGAVEDAVRKDDEALVNDCKDDINTLLTFAGLYSAALTALLALAFGMLQEDVATESLQVLRRISTQTMTYQILPGGLLNATIVPPPPPPPSPFQPSDQAIRVNVLWFASLVLSLTTASIGILVKQWLRAYTTYTTSSAQSRMRTRRFRRRGLELWKVFEIAAALPYLIQLALGLFFIGLCYFTAEVDPRLGNTTLPLVAAWAFFFLMTSLFPVFSSQCPYKGVSFEHKLSSFRRQLFSAIATAALMPPRMKNWAKARTVGPDSHYSEPYDPIDEVHAAKYTGNDTLVMTWADGMQSDDELLGHRIVAALKQSQSDIRHVINFVLRAITDRTQADEISVDNEPKLLDYTSLTPQAYTGVIDVLSQTSSDHVVKWLATKWHKVRWEQYIYWTLCILYSPSKQVLSASGLRLLGRCHMIPGPRRHGVVDRIAHYVCKHVEAGAALKLSLMAVQHACREDSVGLQRTIWHIKSSLAYYFRLAKLPEPDEAAAMSLSDRQDNPEEWRTFLNESSLVDTVLYLAEVLGQHLQGTPSRSSASEQQDLLDSAYGLILRLSATIFAGSGVSSGMGRALRMVNRDCTEKEDAVILSSLLRARIVQPSYFLSLYRMDSDPFHHYRGEGLELFQSAIQGIIHSDNNMRLASAINLSYIASHVLKDGHFDIKDRDVFQVWRTIFKDLGRLLQDAIAREGKADALGNFVAPLSSQIYLMDDLDTGMGFTHRGEDNAAYIAWSQTFDPEQSVFDDSFVSVMAELYPWRHDHRWRIRRLEDMLKREHKLKNGEDPEEGAAVVDMDDEDDTEGQLIGDEHSVIASESNQAAAHLIGGGENSLMESEAHTAREAAKEKTRVDDDDAGNDTRAACSQPDNPDLARGEQRQSVSSSRIEEGTPYDHCDPVVSSEVTARIMTGARSRRVLVEDGGNGGPERTTSKDDGDNNGSGGPRALPTQDTRSLPSGKQTQSVFLPLADDSGGGDDPAVSGGIENSLDATDGGGIAGLPEDGHDGGTNGLQGKLTGPSNAPEQPAIVPSPSDEGGGGPDYHPIVAGPQSDIEDIIEAEEGMGGEHATSSHGESSVLHGG